MAPVEICSEHPIATAAPQATACGVLLFAILWDVEGAGCLGLPTGAEPLLEGVDVASPPHEELRSGGCVGGNGRDRPPDPALARRNAGRQGMSKDGIGQPSRIVVRTHGPASLPDRLREKGSLREGLVEDLCELSAPAILDRPRAPRKAPAPARMKWGAHPPRPVKEVPDRPDEQAFRKTSGRFFPIFFPSPLKCSGVTSSPSSNWM